MREIPIELSPQEGSSVDAGLSIAEIFSLTEGFSLTLGSIAISVFNSSISLTAWMSGAIRALSPDGLLSPIRVSGGGSHPMENPRETSPHFCFREVQPRWAPQSSRNRAVKIS